MYDISLICVFNNSEMKDIMVDSAKKQKDVNIEYIMIDNTDNRFPSGASALNYVLVCYKRLFSFFSSRY